MYPRLGPAVPGVPPNKLVATQDKLIRELRQASSLSYHEFDSFILPSILLFAEYVHLLPASEYDHHSDLGGLFRHGLEVALNASRRAEGKEFALNEVPSIRKFQIARWRACALLGGMLHDLGKAVIDVGAKNVAGDKVWNPHVQPLWRWIHEHQVEQYMIRWRETRRHKEHDAISATVLVRIIPEATMRWLGEYGGRAAYDAMLMALTGSSDRSNPLVEIIKKADQDSVSADRAESQRRLASIGEAGSRSDAAILVRSMRDLILKGDWQINTLGHIVWHTDRGIYVMYPQCAKEAIEHMRETNVSSTLPNEPPVVLDVLRNAGIVVQNNLPSGKAYDLHRIKIYCKDRDGSELALDLTALKFANDRIIPDYFALPAAVHIDICDPDGKLIETTRPAPPSATETTADKAAPETAQPSEAAATQVSSDQDPPAPGAADQHSKEQAPSKPSAPGPSSNQQANKKKKREPVDHLASIEGLPFDSDLPASDDDHHSMVFHDNDEMMEELLGQDPPYTLKPNEDTPLRDRANERDARIAVIEDSRAEATAAFPPTTRESAELWLKSQAKRPYLNFLIERTQLGDIKLGASMFNSDGHLYFHWPECYEGIGIDPPAILNTLNEEEWLAADPQRPKLKVVSFKAPNGDFIQTIRFTYGISRVLELLMPVGATKAPVVDVGPYITGLTSRLLTTLPPEDPLWVTIYQAAFYKRLEDLYAEVEGGITAQSPKALYSELGQFMASHAVPGAQRSGVRNVSLRFGSSSNPLATKESSAGVLIINPNYDRQADDLEIQKAIASL